jgi:uncharacterized zinc-type alcohol dehydrogenase-like protein
MYRSEHFSLTARPRSPAGSEIGGIHEIQEMLELDLCGRYGVGCDVEVVPTQKADEAYEGKGVLKSDVRTRFVIDMASLARD